MSLYGGDKGSRGQKSPTMSVNETAAYLKLHPLTVRKLAREGAIPAHKAGKAWRVDRAELERWVSERTQQNLASSKH